MHSKHHHLIIATYALLVLAAPLVWGNGAQAQVSCPAGYTCTPAQQTGTFSNGYYWGTPSYTTGYSVSAVAPITSYGPYNAWNVSGKNEISVLAFPATQIYQVGTPLAISWIGAWNGSDVFDVTVNGDYGKSFAATGITQAQAGCAGTGRSVCTYRWAPASAGRIQLIVTDRRGVDNAGGSQYVSISPSNANTGNTQTPLNATCTGSPFNGVPVGVTWSAQVAGGQSPYQYSWSLNNQYNGFGTDGTNTSQRFTVYYGTADSKSAVVRITDSRGVSVSTGCSATIPANPTSMMQNDAKPILYGVSPISGGSQTTVTLTGTGLSTASSIEFLNGNGQAIGSVTPSYSSANSVTFTISGRFAANTNPGNYQIRAITNACPAGCVSNLLGFTLLPTAWPSATANVQVWYPNGGETLTTGQTFTISFNPAGAIGKLLQVSLINADTNSESALGWVVGQSTDKQGFYTVLSPTLTPGNYKIRVMSPSDASLQDTSDTSFRVSSAGRSW